MTPKTRIRRGARHAQRRSHPAHRPLHAEDAAEVERAEYLKPLVSREERRRPTGEHLTQCHVDDVPNVVAECSRLRFGVLAAESMEHGGGG